jgi:hypothetical protein
MTPHAEGTDIRDFPVFVDHRHPITRRAMLHRRFVGRERQLAELETMCGSSAVPTRWATLVEGAAGIGKTRLIHEFIRDLPGRIVVVTAGEFEQATPLYIVHEILTRLNDTLDAEAEVLAGGDPRALLTRLRDALAAEPTLLVLDDVHWVDEESLRLLVFLIRNPPTPGFRVILSCRERLCPAPLAAALFDVTPPVIHMQLPPLSDSDAADLLADTGLVLRDELLRSARGNPLYLLLMAMNPHIVPPLLDEFSFGPATLPPDLPDLDRTIAAEMAGMPAVQRTVLHAAAVCGDINDLGLLCAVADLPSDSVTDAVDSICDRGLMATSERGLTFHHPLARAAAYRLAGEGWLIRAHHNAAQYLRSRNAPLLMRAIHLERSLRALDESATAELVAAAELALAVSPATSARWFSLALSVLPPIWSEPRSNTGTHFFSAAPN